MPDLRRGCRTAAGKGADGCLLREKSAALSQRAIAALGEVKMPDLADIAQERYERELAILDRERQLANSLIKAARLHGRPVTHCIDCGEPIPHARQAHGFDQCVSCVEEHERIAQMARVRR